jgi:hypothetical protein
MITLIFSTLLLGAAVGMRFKVLTLVPAIGLACVIIITIGIAAEKSIATIAIATITAACSLQIGYLAGAFARLSNTVGGADTSLLQPGPTRYWPLDRPNTGARQ